MKIAAVTMVFNERVFLPIWLQHYGSQLGAENLFVIDDGSDDGSTLDNPAINLVRKRRGLLDEEDRARLVSAFHEELLGSYDCVLYTDVDEMIVVDPRAGMTLGEFVERTPASCLATIGFNVVHDVRTEPGIDAVTPLFHQRHLVEFDKDYCKPLIARRPMKWSAGFHFSQSLPPQPLFDRRVLLFHLRAMDRDLAMSRLRTLNRVKLSERSTRKGQSMHFAMDEGQYADLLFGRCRPGAAKDDFDQFVAMLTDALDSGEGGRFILLNDKSMHRLPERFRDTIHLKDAVDDLVVESGPRPAGSRPKGKAVDAIFAGAVRRMVRDDPKRNRNSLCPCGSGKKFKHCHE